MKTLKVFSAVATTSMALMAFGGASTATATTIEFEGTTMNLSVAFEMSLKPGSSFIIKDKSGTTTDTCTASEIGAATVSPYTTLGKAQIGGNLYALRFASCNHTTHVLNKGKFYLYWSGSGTNGIFGSSGAEVTLVSTVFGASAICKTGAGSALGTITGVSSGPATFHLNAQIDCGILGIATWSGTYTVTSTGGFGVES